MKKIITLLVLVIGMITTAQTQINLSGMTSNITLGQNCSQSQNPEEYVTTANINLNGFTLNLKNVKLTVRGNLNGIGNVTHCGQSNIVLQGIIQNNPNLNNIPITSIVLDLKEFELQNIKYYEDIKIFDLQGKYISKEFDFEKLKSGIYIVLVKGYKSIKIYKN